MKINYPLNLRELVRVSRGELWLGNPHQEVSGLSIDSRTILPGEFFLAIPGKNYDGHQFVFSAIQKGASGIVVSRSDWQFPEENTVLPAVVRVENTVEALLDIAGYLRNKFSGPVVAITGTSGKTTTKEMIRHLLSDYSVVSNIANFNNYIGASLTVLAVSPTTKYLITELGTSAPGEIDRLGKMVSPDIAVITNVGKGHLLGLKDIEGVRKEKSDLARHIRPHGTIIVGGDDPGLVALVKEKKPPETKLITFGLSSENDFFARNIEVLPDAIKAVVVLPDKENILLSLSVPGEFNIKNVLASLAVVWALGLEVKKLSGKVKDFPGVPERMQVHKTTEDILLVNDAYNSNPTSLRAAIDSFINLAINREKIFVLGDMKELGEREIAEHISLADYLLDKPWEMIFFTGELMRYTYDRLYSLSETGKKRLFYCSNKDELRLSLAEVLQPGQAVFFKASHVVGLSEVFNYFAAG